MRPIPMLMFALLWSVAPARADVSFVVETTDLSDKSSVAETHQFQLTADKVAVFGKAENAAVVFRGDRDVLQMIQHEDKVYQEIDRETLGAMGQQMGEAMKAMQAELAKLPPEQRAQAEAMMGGMMGKPEAMPERQLKATGAKQDVDGVTCTKWESWVGGKKVAEMWVAKWSDLKLKPEDLGAFQKMMGFTQKMVESIPGMAETQDTMFHEMEKMQGLPLLTRDFEDGKPASESRVRDIRSGPVPASAFEVPQGYKKEAMPTFE